MTPVTLCGKLSMQELTANHELKWDEPMPQRIASKFADPMCLALTMAPITLPRSTFVASPEPPVLVGFCDGSEMAYGSVIYSYQKARDGSAGARLVIAKSRVFTGAFLARAKSFETLVDII